MLHAVLALSLVTQLPIDSAGLERAADRILGHRPEGLAGAALVVVHGSRVLLAKGYGSAGNSGPVDPSMTLFRAASIGKLFVATAALQLRESGKLDLDRNIADYLPELELARRGWPPVTMRQLLSHTAGVEDAFVGTIERVGPRSTTLADYFRRRPPSLGSVPGEQVNYSNLGAALGALIVERISGVPFAEYVATHIFQPLGMTRSTYAEPLPPSLRAAVAGDTAIMKYRLIPYPAGSLVTSASDMGRFISSQLNDGALGEARVLDSVSIAMMQTPAWRADPQIPGVALGYFESELAGERILFHTGSRGHHSVLVLLPQRRLGFYAVLDARQGLAGPLRDELTQALVGARWRKREPVSGLPRAAADAYVGRYRLNAGSRHSFEKLAKLAMGDVVVTRDTSGLVLHREGPLPLAAIGDDVFQTNDGMFVAFRRGADGSVDRMHASGRLMDGVSLDRLAFWESSTLHRATLGGSFLLAWISTIGIAVAFLWRRLRGRSNTPAVAWPRRLSRGATALYAVSPLPAIAVMLSARDATIVELSPALTLVRSLLGIAVVAALGASLALVAKAGVSQRRVQDGVFVLVAVCTTVVLAYWRLLPLPG